MAANDANLVEALFSHIVLPPKLPRKFDGDNVSLIQAFGRRLERACTALRHVGQKGHVWDALIASLKTAQILNNEFLAKDDLLKSFKRFTSEAASEWLILHVREQNAAILIHRDHSTNSVIFESFQAAAPAPLVLQANHALTWDFPDRAVSIPFKEFTSESFQQTFSIFLEQASSTCFDDFAARGKKAGRDVVESRGVANPALVNGMLLSLLEATGHAVSVQGVRKRVRDDVVLGATERPWRRSSYWLVLRVATRRILSTLADSCQAGRVYYKFIMCMVLSDLLKDCVGSVHPEYTLMLQAKLGRRLAKLETERSPSSPRFIYADFFSQNSLRPLYTDFFSHISQTCANTMSDSQQKINTMWYEFKRATVRRIPPLPHRAPEADMRLKLTNSGKTLLQLLSPSSKKPTHTVSLNVPPLGEGTILQVGRLADRHAALVDFEDEGQLAISASPITSEIRCQILAQRILSYMKLAKAAYAGDSLMMSRYLLRLFELWMAMDQAAIKACPVLEDFHPVFVPHSLDVLCLMTSDEMRRLGLVQEYNAKRIKSHRKNGLTLFSDPKMQYTFPECYMQHEDLGRPLGELGRVVDKAATTAAKQTQTRLDRMMETYNRLTEEMSGIVCTCTRKENGHRDGRGCPYCDNKRQRKKRAISIHEDFLPQHQSHKAAILFELSIPPYLASYREAVWRLSCLGQGPPPPPSQPSLFLEAFDPLKGFWKSSVITSVKLASKKEAYTQTHYRQLKLPKRSSEVLLPFGPEMAYYDSELSSWTDAISQPPWFEHLMGSWIPKGIPDPYEDANVYARAITNTPTSYDITASDSTCPPEISIHEYRALQRIVSGRGRRWLEVLVELGATNINFSSEDAMALVNHAALQAGPPLHGAGPIREVHLVFDDVGFCTRLHQQLLSRLNAVAPSWREVNCLSVLTTLTLRLYNLCDESYKSKAEELLVRIREIASTWIMQLRSDLRTTQDAEAARRYATHAFWAALLCRQTFQIYSDFNPQKTNIPQDEMRHFFRESIALQENLLVELGDLHPVLNIMLRRDIVMAHIMRDTIKRWAVSSPKTMEAAINEIWADAGGSSAREYSAWQFPSKSKPWWVASRVLGDEQSASQVVHYHVLHGHLMIDGKPFGRLPLEMREDSAIKELFGTQHLLTCSSSLPGMQYQLVNDSKGHQVHFGIRSRRVVIRARWRGQTFEHIPRETFGNAGEDTPRDLPFSLVEDCVHWLDLKTGKLDIRRQPAVWTQKSSRWVLDVRKRQAIRGQGTLDRAKQVKLGTCLVEPQSETGRKVAAIFNGFEDRDKLTIFQPLGKGSLSVEMKRLEISFKVNKRRRFMSGQLRAEIDPNQDVGTFYGLRSHIVVRDTRDFAKRSILVPMGNESAEHLGASWTRKGIHVAVKMANDGMYARYSIDAVLGRVTCPPEPGLLYLKAALHSMTSFPIPDSLTSRTGTEEAKHCLSSSRHQPWAPLASYPREVLRLIASISPRRHYYPTGLKLYQKLTWDKELTMTIQHEELFIFAQRLLQQSDKLATFYGTVDNDTESEDSLPSSVDHLNLRALYRRQIYQRINLVSDSGVITEAARDLKYLAKSRFDKSEQNSRVFKVIKELNNASSEAYGLQNIKHLIEAWGTVGGFGNRTFTLDIETLLSADVAPSWGTYVEACRTMNHSTAYRTRFLLALLAFGKHADPAFVYWLATLAKDSSLRAIPTPKYEVFHDFRFLEKPKFETLKSLILHKQRVYGDDTSNTPSYNAPTTVNIFTIQQTEAAEKVAAFLIDQWPSIPISHLELRTCIKGTELQYIDCVKAWSFAQPELTRLAHNEDLSNYLVRLDKVAKGSELQMQHRGMHRIPCPAEVTIRACGMKCYTVPKITAGLITKTIKRVNGSSLQVDEMAEPEYHEASVEPVSQLQTSRSKEIVALESIVADLRKSSSTTRKQYASSLQQSIIAFSQAPSINQAQIQAGEAGDQYFEIKQAKNRISHCHRSICDAFSSKEPAYGWLDAGNLWPCLSPVSILEQLRKANNGSLGVGMKHALIHYGLLISKLQRLERMRDAWYCYDDRRYYEEEQHKGHSNWNPMDYPDWLLLEIDSNILIRGAQVEVARAIISPDSKVNSVLQMNMGQGKTSCILPMAVTMLADRTQLCRLVVPKALLLQTAQIIQSRLGGLVGRQVKHLPFNRRSPSRIENLDLFHDIHHETLQTGGVMICLPEHILSFRLSGMQSLADGRLDVAKTMVDIQRWLDSSSRDILDESDFILSPKTQLIYPSGYPTAVDGHPQRWQVIEELLSLAEGHTSTLEARFGTSIQVVWRHKGYPIIHFLHPKVEDALNNLLVNDICEGRLTRLQLRYSVCAEAKQRIRDILAGVNVKQSTWNSAISSLTDDVFARKTLCLLRGLISQRILLLCLAKRWNVQYGLHPTRPPIAVPFEAKGVPSATSEYGHPDTALVLTCLAFYQTGLTRQQIIQCLQNVMKSDDPAAHWENLIHSCRELPATLRYWNLLNPDEVTQMEHLWGYLSFDRTMVNYFMNNFVFPCHAKQFGVKIQGSGWDIPLSNDAAGRNLTTGFSGTNDNKGLLPQTIQQSDLLSLRKTNAEVLSYLLEERNETCYEAKDESGRPLEEDGLLRLLCKQRIRILIDAGAMILEMENYQLAKAWLTLNRDAEGAVYFDKNSRVMVCARFLKAPILLSESPFADNLDKCVVYIDQQHTRGTDLKLPLHSRGAVTLGLGQTKDATVQAAMRLRQLGSTQSVAFVAPPEVHRSILDLRPLPRGRSQVNLPVKSVDVVRWLLEKSCLANDNLSPLHISQGVDFCRRTDALWKHDDFLTNTASSTQLLDVIQQKEEQTLEEMYGPKASDMAAITLTSSFSRLQSYIDKINQMKREMHKTGRITRSSAFEEVEQEREVEFEVEQVCERQRAPKLEPLRFPGLAQRIVKFVRTGILDESGLFIQAFAFIGSTLIGRQHGVQKTASRLYVTIEFSNTIVAGGSIRRVRNQEGLIRPVEWVLWSPSTKTALIVIPEEAELLLPVLRQIEDPKVWLLTYAAPVTKTMQVFNSLLYYTVPPQRMDEPLPDWLVIELCVLAGGLYFEYKQYKPLLSWLGVGEESGSASTVPAGSGSSASVASLIPRGLPGGQSLKFLLEWLTYQRQTEDILNTPMGFVCQHRALNPGHSFFTLPKELEETEGKATLARALASSKSQDIGESSSDSEGGSVWEYEVELQEDLTRDVHVRGDSVDEPMDEMGWGNSDVEDVEDIYK